MVNLATWDRASGTTYSKLVVGSLAPMVQESGKSGVPMMGSTVRVVDPRIRSSGLPTRVALGGVSIAPMLIAFTSNGLTG